MSNIIRAEVHIQGTRSLLWHHFTVEALAAGRKERKGTAGNDPDEWKQTVMIMGENNQLYLDDMNIFACLREGAKHTRRNRSTLQSAVSATLQVTDPCIPIRDRYLPDGLTAPPPTDPTLPVYLDVRGVRNPVTKGRNVRYRVACSAGWECSFHLIWDKTILSREQVEAVTRDAGQLVGLGSGRSIGFGRFEIVQFRVEE
jgi:hypothetical protein